MFINVSASRRKPSSGLTSSVGRQYVKACPICGLIGSFPRLDSCCKKLAGSIHVVGLPDPYGLYGSGRQHDNMNQDEGSYQLNIWVQYWLVTDGRMDTEQQHIPH